MRPRLRPSSSSHTVLGNGQGKWAREVRLAGFLMSGAQSPFEASKGNGAALLLWEAEKGICLTFLSLYHSVAMPVLPFPCQYSCFYAGTAVARLQRGCWKRTSGCFEDEKMGDESRVMLWLLNPTLLPA